MVDVAAVMAKPYTVELLERQPLARFAYTAKDGSPRVIPIGCVWDGTAFVMWTIPTSAKVTALRADPRVALTIDVLDPPMRTLLARGSAQLRRVAGVPDGYLEASHRVLPQQAWAGFDEQVRNLYDSMVEIAIHPTWAKLIDFETTAPRAVEKLMQQKGLSQAG
jgi:hypothetical protein